jgi:hypothetical protein
MKDTAFTARVIEPARVIELVEITPPGDRPGPGDLSMSAVLHRPNRVMIAL